MASKSALPRSAKCLTSSDMPITMHLWPCSDHGAEGVASRQATEIQRPAGVDQH